MATIWLEIGIILVLIVINGFFSMAEMAIVSSKAVHLKNLAKGGDSMAQSAYRLQQQPDRFFSTVQIGITLVGIFTGAYGGATLAETIAAELAVFPALESYADTLGLICVVVPITYLTLIIGELVPKRLAFAYPIQLAKFAAPTMLALMYVSLPAVRFLSASTGFVLRLLRLRASGGQEVTEEEIRSVIAEGAQSGILETAERDMMDRVIRLGDRHVAALMTHRSQIVWLDLDDPWEFNVKKIKESTFSRFPVAQGGLENLLGVLKIKNLFDRPQEFQADDLRSMLHEPLYVPESMRALKLLELFKTRSRMHFAFVIDEFGDILGIVTLNDVLEALIGDLPTTEEPQEKAIVQRADGSWLIDAMTPFDEVLRLLELSHEGTGFAEGDFKTIAGFCLKSLGNIPSIGDRFVWRDVHIEIVDMDGRRIDRILVERKTIPNG
ncbi:hemolysin family protein [Solidesulfovibrio sp. C21]|uniref:hemolysin family protein n=1 Tax=Solidesulfovibrio sp. C21 TaxID=3398613 RepID=UPI0039FD2051